MLFMRARVIFLARVRFAAAFASAWGFEILAVLLLGGFFVQKPQYFWALGAHFMSAASFLAVTPKPRSIPGIGYYYPRFAAMLTFFLPGLGIVGISLTMLGLRYMKSQGLAEEYKEKSFEDEVFNVEVPTDITSFLLDEIDVHPIADILAGEDVPMKRGAVNLLRRIGSAEAVALLRKSLSDSNAEIRFYAHTALTRLEEDYVRQIEDSRFKAERFERPKSYAELAMTYRNYARSGLPETSMQQYYLQKSCEAWEKALEKDPVNLEYRLKLAEEYADSGRYDESVKIYRNTALNPEAEMESRLGICRAYFEQGDYESFFREVDDLRARPVPEGGDPYRMLVYNFWMDREGQYEQGA